METKIIANIAKIKKLNATDHAAKIIDRFFRQLGKENKKLAKTLSQKFAQFMGLGNEQLSMTEDDTNTAGQTDSNTDASPAITQTAATMALPVTAADFDKYIPALKEYHQGNEHNTTLFNGRYVNKYWLEHNLLQHTLAPQHQHFITEADFAHHPLTRRNIEKEIERYLHMRGW